MAEQNPSESLSFDDYLAAEQERVQRALHGFAVLGDAAKDHDLEYGPPDNFGQTAAIAALVDMLEVAGVLSRSAWQMRTLTIQARMLEEQLRASVEDFRELTGKTVPLGALSFATRPQG